MYIIIRIKALNFDPPDFEAQTVLAVSAAVGAPAIFLWKSKRHPKVVTDVTMMRAIEPASEQWEESQME